MKRFCLILVALVAIINLNGQDLFGRMSEVTPMYLNPEDGGSPVLRPVSYDDPEPEFLPGMTEEEYVELYYQWENSTRSGARAGHPDVLDGAITKGSYIDARLAIEFCNNCNGCDPIADFTNPPLTAECQQDLNIVLVIDESGSISSSEAALVENGVIAFLDDLSCTDASIAIVEFGSVADYVVDAYTDVMDVQDGMQDYFDGDATTSGNFTGQVYQDAQYATNWHAAMILIDELSPRPDMILFFTDGDPTAYSNVPTNPTGTYSTCGAGSSTDPPELFNAVEVANNLKDEGAHMFVLGVGTTGSSSIARIQAISGTTVFNAAGTGDATNVATADYAITTNFSQMQASLQEFVANLCPFLTACEPTHTCDGSTDGTITVDFANDATPPFFVSLDGGTVIETSASSYTFSGLSAGSYAVTASESSGCTREATCSTTVLNSPALVLTDTITNNNCNGENNGIVDLRVSGGTAPYTYLWNTGATTQDISNLVAGTYSVTVTDALDCIAMHTATVTQPDTPTGSAPCDCAHRWEEGGHWNADGTINDANNAPDPKGIIRCGNAADTESGITSLGCVYDSSQFKIDLSSVTCYAPNTGLPVSIAEPNQGCPISWFNFDARAYAGSYSYQVVTNDDIGWALYYSNTHTNGLNANGLSGSGDCSDLIYWACGSAFSNTWVTFTVPSFTQATNLYLAVWDMECGTDACAYNNDLGYNFKARQGCGDGPPLCNLETQTETTSCNTNGTYTVEVPIVGANGDYFGYDPNATPTRSNLVILGNLGDGGPTSGTITMTYPVSVTTYNIEIADSNLATGGTDPANVSECVDIVSGTAPQCCILDISDISSTNVTCNGGSNGTITITATGNSLEYSINNGASYQASNEFTGLAPATYPIIVRETADHSCFETGSATITQPPAVTLSATPVDVKCDDDNGPSNDGSVTLTPTNGTGPYTYTLDGSSNNTGVFDNLAAGPYSASLVDANGCTASTTFTIGIALPFTASETHTDVVCNDDEGSSEDGTATITATNGVGTLSYELDGVTNGTGVFTGLAEGSYTATITDANGCEASVPVTIGIALPFTASETHTDVVCNDDEGSSEDGTATITATNGVGTLSYELDGVTNGTGVFTGLAEGSYTATITDANGCTASVPVTIGIALPFTASETHTDVVCNDDEGSSEDGTATITATNGVGTLSYELDGVTNGTGVFTGLAEGSYTATITDANGCIASVPVTIGIALPFTASETHTDVVCNDDEGSSEDGTATITATNGVGTLSYELDGVTNGTGVFTGLAEGSYTATITDANGCIASVPVTIGIALPFTASETHTDVVCNDGSGTSDDGTATITATNGVGTLSYELDGVTNGTGIFTDLAAGSYTATITDANGCIASVPVTIGIALPFTASETHTDVVCNDDEGSSEDGTATITATNGVGTLSYELDGVTNGTGVFTGLAEGSYTATITDANGCVASVPVTIGIALPFTASETHTDVVCNDGSGTSDDGTATITATNGVGTLSYELDGVTNGTGIFTDLAAGSYTATITDANGCEASVPVTIGLASALSASETHTDVVCNDDEGSSEDGTATITATNGVGTLSYELDGVTNGTGVFTGLDAGSYTGIVTDANGCTATVPVTIGIALPFTASETHTDVVCNDDEGSSEDGTATITATNGVGTLSYELDGVTNGTGVFTGLDAGSYTGIVTDANGCTASVPVTIGIALPFTASETHTDVVCNDDEGSSEDGTATITATNGVGTLSYELDGVTNGTGVFTGLAEGSYTATITDANGCIASVPVTIGIALPFTASETHTDVVCNDDEGSSEDGTATITATNGIGTLSYELDGVTNGTGVFTGLAEGSYTATITDANGCIASVPVTIGIALPFTASETHTDVVCNDDEGSSEDGTATITAANGVGTLSYELDGVTNGTGVFTNLAEGSYTATITDANGCVASVPVTIGIALPFTASETHTDVVCNDGSGTSDDGTATITATNGVGTLSYELDGVTNGTGIFTDLAAGSYTATITDANGCIASVPVTIGLASALSASETHTDVVCNDDEGSSEDGTATITATNGVGTLSYELDGVTNGTGVFTGLDAGTYTGIVTDANGCTASVPVTIGIALPFTASETHTDVVCNDDEGSSEDGTATITATNGVGTLSYELDGVTNGTGVFTGLAEGSYTATITDANGCIASVPVTIGIALPFTASETHTDVVCNDDEGSSEDGTATITATNGVGTLSYELDGVTNGTGVFTGLAEGSYTATITDANGCIASVPVTIGIALPFTASETHTDVVCNDDEGSSEDGTATITATNGVGTLSYELDGVTNGTGVFTDLAEGSYTATITDANGCVASVPVTIGIALPFTASETHTDVVCNDGSGTSDDGTATITATNGVGTLSYELDGVTNGTGIFTDLAAGSYTATITDANGCIASVPVTIGLASALSASETHTDVVCNDDEGSSEDGTATITATNGVGTLSYELDGVTNGTGVFTGLDAGSYTGIVTDANGCTASVPVTIGIALPFTASETHTDVVCNDDEGSSEDGTATITATNGVGTLSYELDGVTNGTGVFTGLAEGSYTATITDANGCIASVPVTIGIALPFTASETHTDVVCNDDEGSSEDGTATITATNGVGTLSYELDGVTNSTGVFTDLAEGSYTATITDANGCIASVPVTIGIALPFTASETHTDVVCNDDEGSSEDGTATITATNGVGTLSYELDGVTNGTGVFTDLAEGSYTATITDANGCIASVPVTIGLPLPLSLTEQHTDVLCNDGQVGSNDGTVTLTPVNGVGPFTFTLDGNSNDTGIFTGLADGDYTGTVVDADGCTASVDVTIILAAPLVVTETHVDVICEVGGATGVGSIDVTVTGGTPPYTYSWNTEETSQDLNGIDPGTYIITVTDNNQCVEERTIIVEDLTAEPGASANGGELTCAVINVQLTGSSPTEGVSYSWSGPEGFTSTEQNPTVSEPGLYVLTVTNTVTNCISTAEAIVTEDVARPGASAVGGIITCEEPEVQLMGSSPTEGVSYSWTGPGGYTSTEQNPVVLTAGLYTLTVTNETNGCTSSATANVMESTFAPELTLSSTNIPCFGMNNGSASVSFQVIFPPYTIEWSNGGTGSMINNLAPGTYTVTVMNGNGCPSTGEVTITEAPELEASETHVDLSCNDDAGLSDDGSIDVSVTGGTPPYTYLWDNGSTQEDLSGLTVGTYVIMVVDANQCMDELTVSIEAPEKLTIEETHIDVSCVAEVAGQAGGPSNDGSIDITVSGGTGSYTYDWSNGSTDEDISDLAAGTYSVTVYDQFQCSASIEVTIEEPEVLEISIDASNDVTCAEAADGSINISVSGGTEPYVYSWNNGAVTEDIGGLEPGTYIVTVVDANECTATEEVTISEPRPLSASASPSDLRCGDSGDGAVDLTVTGGTEPYSFDWSNGATSEDISGLEAGTYDVTVTDANGCVAETSATINAPELLTASASASAVSCNGAEDGSIDLTVSGGTEPYSILWSNGSTDEDISGLAPGTYSVTVFDANQCSAEAEATVEDADALTVEIDAVSDYGCGNVSCFGASDGSVDISVSGGTGTYTYVWSNGAGTEDLTGIPAGIYSITVTDESGCTASADVELTQPEPITIEIDSISVYQPHGLNVSCAGLTDGYLSLNVSGGCPPYTYVWSNGASTEELNNIGEGNYIVDVVDANGCSSNSEFLLDAPPRTQVQVPVELTGGGCEGGPIVLSTLPGNTEYQWYLNGLPVDGATDNVLVTDVEGTYLVEIDNDEACATGFSEPMQVSINPISPVALSTVGEEEICEGDTYTLEATEGFESYTWYMDGQEISGADSSSYTTGLAGDYTVTAFDSLGCFSESDDTLTLIVNPNPAPRILMPDGVICTTSGIVELSASPEYETYEWYYEGEPIEGENGNTLQADAQGEYVLVVSYETGCVGSDTADLAFETIDVHTDTVYTQVVEAQGSIVCLDESVLELEGDIASVTICGEPEFVTYEYEIDGGTVCFEINYEEGGRFGDDIFEADDQICVITCDTTECAVCDTTIIIIDLPEPPADQPPVAVEECVEVEENNEIEVDVLSNDMDPDGDDIYVTSVISGPNHGSAIVTGDGTAILYIPEQDYCGPDTFYYEVCDIDNQGCDTAYVCVDVLCDCFIPNVLTPNNDNLNDYFTVECLEDIDDALLRVYNRWGNEVYNNPNYKNNWNGLYKGKPLPEGTYYFLLEFTDRQGNEIRKAGDLTILR